MTIEWWVVGVFVLGLILGGVAVMAVEWRESKDRNGDAD